MGRGEEGKKRMEGSDERIGMREEDRSEEEREGTGGKERRTEQKIEQKKSKRGGEKRRGRLRRKGR